MNEDTGLWGFVVMIVGLTILIIFILGSCAERRSLESKAKMCVEGHKPSCEFFNKMLERE